MRIKTAADLQAEREAADLQAERAAARAYLADTDWYVTRLTETGEPIPPAVSKERAAARKAAR